MSRPLNKNGRNCLLAGAGGILLLCAGAWVDRQAFFACWLAAWWTCAGAVLGSQANLWLHDLTGGAWARPLRPIWQGVTAGMPVLLALMLPVVGAAWLFYPWSQGDWTAHAEQSAFKTYWLSPAFVTSRLIIYAALWQALALLSLRRHSKGASAASLLLYGVTATLAGIDLIQSLLPQWYSSGFGLIVLAMQMKLGFAIAVVLACRSRDFSPGLGRDWGNLLLMYVLMWAYVAFVQFLIIWAENLPAEIAWYVPRLQTNWIWLGVALVILGFFLPLLLLLFRSVKQDARRLRLLALLLCALGWLESIWITLPSVSGLSWHVLWMSPLAMACMATLLWGVRP